MSRNLYWISIVYEGIQMYPVFSLSYWFWDGYKLSWKDFEMIR